jgi:ABC-type polysaccharide/polyol phosphate export permease
MSRVADTPLPAREVRYAAPIWRQWNLIWNFAQRDRKAQFKGSALGWLWSLVVPLATLGIYSLVFAVVMRVAPPPFGNGREGIFSVFLFSGLVSWGFFTNSIQTGMLGLLGTGQLLKKIYFPAYAPVLGSVVFVGIQSLIEMSLLLVVLALLGNISWTWLLVPLWAVPFIVFVSSLAVGLAIYNVYARDLSHLVSVAMQLLFYLSPIIYPLTLVPESGTFWGVTIPARAIMEASPLTQFFGLFRCLVYDLSPGSIYSWLYVVVAAILALVWAARVYQRRAGDLGELV